MTTMMGAGQRPESAPTDEIPTNGNSWNATTGQQSSKYKRCVDMLMLDFYAGELPMAWIVP